MYNDYMKQFIIDKKYNNKNIYWIMRKLFPHMPISSLNKVFRIKDVKVNDLRVTKDYIAKTNDVVKIYVNDSILFGLNQNLYYAYEDDNILVAYKPKGVQSNFEGNSENKDTLVPCFDELVMQDKGNNIAICHRLDTNTEGLVIFAKDEISHQELLNAFKENKIHKEYIALVYGKLPKSQDTLSHYIIKDEKTGFSKVIDKKLKGSKSCITEYEVIKYIKNKDCSVVKIKLHTGRTHQIRAHMKYLNCPVVGDSKYSTNEINCKYKVSSQILFASKYTFTFGKDSSLNYLNDVVIDITSQSLDKIQNIINDC